MTPKILKLKQRKITHQEEVIREALKVFRAHKDVLAAGYFVKTKDFSYYDANGRSNDMITGSQLLAQECINYAMKDKK